MRKYLLSIIILSCSFASAQTSDLKELLRDPARQDEIVEALDGNHLLIMKLIDKLSEHPHFREMMKERFAAEAKTPEGSPYAGEEGREIKALSAGEIREYLEGEGMGLAKPAELNGYPGPRHVLDLSDKIKLTPDQTRQITTSFEQMHTAATRLGAQIVTQERAIDSLFKSHAMNQALLEKNIRKSASLQGELRIVHLQAHLNTSDLLTSGQKESYMILRGYTKAAPGSDMK